MGFYVTPLVKTPSRMAALLSPLLSSSSPTNNGASNPSWSSAAAPFASGCGREAAASVLRAPAISSARALQLRLPAISASASFSCASGSFSISSGAGRGFLSAFSGPAPPAPAAAAAAAGTARRNPMTTNASSATAPSSAKSVHDFTVKDINGEDVDLMTFKGKVLLIVNVASACGLTKGNYTELAELYAGLKQSGLEILAFPCNQFGGQEPGTNEQIKEFACTRFKAEYPIFDKVEVNGPNTAPIYQFLKASKGGGILGDNIKWNFGKFLVNQDGVVVERYAPTTSPKKIEGDIKKLLGE